MEHYFSAKPKSKNITNLITYNYNLIEFKFYTSSSVFSKEKVDKGTDLLLRESRINPEAKMLDLGCGYGPVGIVLSKIYKDAKITMSEINERAISLAKKNLKLNDVNAEIVQSDLFENISEKFNIILSNPPNSAGKKICFKLIDDSFSHLEKEGSLQLVSRKDKGGKELAKHMKEIFRNVETIGRQSGYHLYYSKKE